jgi:dTDP-4-dehydrorhamnose reductase
LKIHCFLFKFMKILITGANGLLGSYFVRCLLAAGHEVVATGLGDCRLRLTDPVAGAWMERGGAGAGAQGRLTYHQLDICDAMAVRSCLRETSADWILHNAAWAQPDACETDPVGCWAVNVTATRFLVDAARESGTAFLLMSTDFVFDGLHGLYRETDPTGPVNYYGCSKRVAEKAVEQSGSHWVIVRTVLVYGQSPTVKRFNLLTWVRDKLQADERIKVVNDQYRTPTYAGDLAEGVRLVLEHRARGIFHISGAEMMTPYDMATATAKTLGLDASLIDAVDGSTFTQPAKRPRRTGFDISKAMRILGYKPRPFTTGLLCMLENDLV